MKIRTIISAIFVIAVTILYYFGFCKWDLWVYLASIICTVLYMLIFMKQQKTWNKLTKQMEEYEENTDKVMKASKQ